jgi:hypothetical protein
VAAAGWPERFAILDEILLVQAGAWLSEGA